MASPIIIKKYANRRLYNTLTSTYITLEDLAALVRGEEDFVVQDAKTGEDLTRSVLTQIIFEYENKSTHSLLPISFLRQMIRFYGDSVQTLVPSFLDASLQNFMKEQDKWRGQLGAVLAAPFSVLEEQARQNMRLIEQSFSFLSPKASEDSEKEALKQEVERLRRELAQKGRPSGD